ncbi:MAG: hypothetical protein H7Y32_03495 [Chloroflexales bacterium]|nr:hypothetical protein [Chloroflexales bacterium]
MFQFLNDLLATIGDALRLRPDVLARVTARPDANGLIALIAVLAGGSLLAGQSVILFVNRVRPSRFAFSLLFNGLLFALELALWASSAWIADVALFGTGEPLLTALRIVGLASAPLVFGFLITLPYLGAPIEWALRIWSLLVILSLVRQAFGYNLWQALACALGGWLLIQVGSALLGGPLGALRDRMWSAVTNTPFDTNQQDLVDAATHELRARLATLEEQVDLR